MILSMNNDYYPKQLLLAGLSNKIQNIFFPRYKTNLHINCYSFIVFSLS